MTHRFTLTRALPGSGLRRAPGPWSAGGFAAVARDRHAIPGPRCLWLKCDISFRNPCYAPSQLRFHGVVTQQSEAISSVALKFDITDDRDREIATAKTLHKVLEQ